MMSSNKVKWGHFNYVYLKEEKAHRGNETHEIVKVKSDVDEMQGKKTFSETIEAD